MNKSSPTRVLVVCSAGGHLLEAMRAIEGVPMECHVATFRLPHVQAPAGVQSMHYLVDPHVSPLKYLVNAFQSLALLLRVRPRVVLTTGAGIAIASALIGKCLGARLVFVETVAGVGHLSRTGSFLSRFADLFIVQWPEACAGHPRAVYGGCIL